MKPETDTGPGHQFKKLRGTLSEGHPQIQRKHPIEMLPFCDKAAKVQCLRSFGHTWDCFRECPIVFKTPNVPFQLLGESKCFIDLLSVYYQMIFWEMTLQEGCLSLELSSRWSIRLPASIQFAEKRWKKGCTCKKTLVLVNIAYIAYRI